MRPRLELESRVIWFGGMVATTYRGVLISVELLQDVGGNWTGKCELSFAGVRTETLVHGNRVFATKQQAKNEALAEARQFIDEELGPRKHQQR